MASTLQLAAALPFGFGAATPGFADGRDIHVAFSSSCNRFQHWQTEVVLHSALRAGHRGPITRIVVGCDESEVTGGGRREVTTHVAGALDESVHDSLWRRSTHPNATLHLAPATPLAKRFPWFNKAWGLSHWARSGALRAATIAVIDPDQFFLAPLTQGGALLRAAWQLDGGWRAEDATDTARPGLGIAQKYGIGAGWLQKFDRQRICGAGSPCTALTAADALKHYSIGTPYVLHAADFSRVMAQWWEFMPAAYEQVQRDIQLDMYAYSMAAAHLGVKHVTMRHHMISSPLAWDEGWKEVDALRSVPCREAGTHGAGGGPWATPTFTHACQTYTALSTGKQLSEPHDGAQLWLFHKGHVPPHMLECGQPLLQPPPDGLIDAQTNTVRRRRAFMVCALHRQVNEAAMAYKRKYCAPEERNLRECIRLTKGGVGDAEFPGRYARRVC